MRCTDRRVRAGSLVLTPREILSDIVSTYFRAEDQLCDGNSRFVPIILSADERAVTLVVNDRENKRARVYSRSEGE